MESCIKWKENEKTNLIEWPFILVWTKRSISRSGNKGMNWNTLTYASVDYEDWLDVKEGCEEFENDWAMDS